jgi:hypothetical protein
MKKTIAAVAIALVASVSACGSSSEPRTIELDTAPAPAAERPSSKELTKLAIRLAFQQESSETRQLMCVAVATSPTVVVEGFIEGAGGTLGLTRAEILKEFQDICAGIDA